ncbi:hypothetical protein HETIRDRAFT_105757 [Heterobasidion irregulare TC 32-1]|uniref:Uncharacterized protein n=1 Tax=Heterobasidion irregulare (strain TC 32-1) TaxID=747525 RepID=W4JVW7_HETIT|nr:uncharacterized protein HETIRDRAFT_105757 [Heterobasidion irregulare TC 32-1]ETW77016.1 hypothetical protein HETIRDRAFT_105757 [Heterobasidion irregulare TC 32-1]
MRLPSLPNPHPARVRPCNDAADDLVPSGIAALPLILLDEMRSRTLLSRALSRLLTPRPVRPQKRAPIRRTPTLPPNHMHPSLPSAPFAASLSRASKRGSASCARYACCRSSSVHSFDLVAHAHAHTLTHAHTYTGSHLPAPAPSQSISSTIPLHPLCLPRLPLPDPARPPHTAAARSPRALAAGPGAWTVTREGSSPCARARVSAQDLAGQRQVPAYIAMRWCQRMEWLQDYARVCESYLPTTVPLVSSLSKPALKANLGLEAKVDAERAAHIDAKACRRNLSQTLGQTLVRSSLFLFHSFLLLPSPLLLFPAVPALLTGTTAMESRDTDTNNDEVADSSGADGGQDDTMFDT